MGEIKVSIYGYWLIFILVIFGAAIMFAASDASLPCPVSAAILRASFSNGCVDFWLSRYQSLIAGIFALVAGIIGFTAIRMQIFSSEKSERARLGREMDAARAVLPLALSSICEYAEQNARALLAFRRSQQRGREGGAFERPALPADTTLALRDCVRTFDFERSRDIARLISFVQVFTARYLNIGARRSSDDDFLYDAAKLYAMASDLFDFARFADDEVEPRGRDMLLALRVMEVPLEQFTVLMRRINGRIEREES